jgi:hypothetical protein
MKRYIYHFIGSILSIGGIIGIILSNTFSDILLFVISSISGLFTIAISIQMKEHIIN